MTYWKTTHRPSAGVAFTSMLGTTTESDALGTFWDVSTRRYPPVQCISKEILSQTLCLISIFDIRNTYRRYRRLHQQMAHRGRTCTFPRTASKRANLVGRWFLDSSSSTYIQLARVLCRTSIGLGKQIFSPQTVNGNISIRKMAPVVCRVLLRPLELLYCMSYLHYM